MNAMYYFGTKAWTGKDGNPKNVVFILGNNRYGDPGVNACYCTAEIRQKAESLSLPVGSPVRCTVDFGGHLLDVAPDPSFCKLPVDVKSTK